MWIDSKSDLLAPLNLTWAVFVDFAIETAMQAGAGLHAMFHLNKVTLSEKASILRSNSLKSLVILWPFKR